jgi:HEAT repeat protein
MYKVILLLATLSILGGSSARDFEVIGTGGDEKRNVSDSELDDGDIASKNYDIAMKALKAAVASRDTKKIRRGLTSPIFSVRIASAKALGDLCDKDCVPALTASLENNQGSIDGGTEMRIFQAELNKEIIAALRNLTSLDLPVSDKPSRKEIAEIIKRVKKWEKDQ